jgi:hypothetical protein
MRVAENIRIDNSEPNVKDYDALIALSYVVFSITFLVILYVASLSAGTASSDFASMSVFP